MNEPAFCSVDSCPNEARRNGLCWAHRKRVARGLPVNVALAEKGGGRWEKVLRAALQYADDTESPARAGEDPQVVAKRASWRFRIAVQRYFEPARRKFLAKIKALERDTFQ